MNGWGTSCNPSSGDETGMQQAIDRLQPIPVGRVDASDFVYNADLGRVECARCGHRAFTRSLAAARIWELAHEKFCRFRDKVADLRCA